RMISSRVCWYSGWSHAHALVAPSPFSTGSTPPEVAMTDSDREHVPTRLRPYYDAIVSRTDAVCSAHLDDEYGQLCRRLAAALCRKRPSPVTSGRIESWACGIAYAIGWVNFLSDSAQTPHLRMADLCALFGVSAATGAAKAAEIRRLFKMRRMD